MSRSLSLSHQCYLQTLPPISHNASFTYHHKPPQKANGSRRSPKLYIACARGNNRASTPNKDDYHSTLKALNSKGRSPRKSLGQVRIFQTTQCVATLRYSFLFVLLRVLCGTFYQTWGGHVLFWTFRVFGVKWVCLNKWLWKFWSLLVLFFDWQNYMLNSDINEQLVGVAGVEEGDVVLEIGPGTGSLTDTLINSGAFVLAVEKVCRFTFCRSLKLTLNQRHTPSYFPWLLCFVAVS